jgi:glycine/D-amino acid oxidase-like deaminating enzyme
MVNTTRLVIIAEFCLSLFSTGICLGVEEGISQSYDIVVYAGTSAGVIAAVQAAQMGKSVVLVCPEKHLGGMTSGGLGFTDSGNTSAIGELSREFYRRIWERYQMPEAWKWQKREEFGNRGQGTAAMDSNRKTMWVFEPHVAEQVYEGMIAQNKIPVHRDRWLDRKSGVKKKGSRIASISVLSGETYRGKMFIDACAYQHRTSPMVRFAWSRCS